RAAPTPPDPPTGSDPVKRLQPESAAPDSPHYDLRSRRPWRAPIPDRPGSRPGTDRPKAPSVPGPAHGATPDSDAGIPVRTRPRPEQRAHEMPAVRTQDRQRDQVQDRPDRGHGRAHVEEAGRAFTPEQPQEHAHRPTQLRGLAG